MGKIVQTAGRNTLGEFAPEFAHFNDDVLFGENWNNQDIDVKTRSIITVVALMASGITDSSHGCILTLVPKKGLAAQREKELEEKLEAYRSSLSEEELNTMVEKTKALEAYQESEEDPEALECIPMLKRSDIKKEAGNFVNEELSVDDLSLIHI